MEHHVTFATIERRAICGDPLATLDMEREFEDVAAVAASLGSEIDVLGHSSGALCAMGAARLMTNVRRLLLFEPPLEDDPAPFQPAMDRMWQQLRTDDIDGVYDTWLKQYVGVPPEPADALKDSPVGTAMRPLAGYLPREMASHLAHRWDIGVLGTIRTPTVYITGSNTVGNEQLRGWIHRLEGAMSNFSVVEIPGQDHFAPMLAPEEFANFLLTVIEAPE
jgi:pimeloyl-ACP methyl ester carboxylesterase